MRKLMIIALLAVWSLIGSAKAEIDEADDPKAPPPFEVTDSQGYRYVYETMKDQHGLNGIITVTAPKSNEIVTKLTDLPSSKCDETLFKDGTIIKTKDKQEFVLICGGDHGLSQILFVFERGNLVTSLEFYDSLINIKQVDNSDVYILEHYNRVLNMYGSLESILTVYKWSPTAEVNYKFYPIHNRFADKYYLKYYEHLKNMYGKGGGIDTPMLTSLISLSSHTKICSEINVYILKKFTVSKTKQLLSFIEKNYDLSFDLSSCQKRR